MNIAFAHFVESTYNVQTKVICVDFSNDAIYEDVRTKLDGLDIGILGNLSLIFFMLNYKINKPTSTYK